MSVFLSVCVCVCVCMCVSRSKMIYEEIYTKLFATSYTGKRYIPKVPTRENGRMSPRSLRPDAT
jgi:hypothetical protein